MFDRKQWGARLGAAIKARGLTQREAARRLDIPPSRLSEYVNGVWLPPYDKMVGMVDTLGLDVRIVFPEISTRALQSVLQEV